VLKRNVEQGDVVFNRPRRRIRIWRRANLFQAGVPLGVCALAPSPLLWPVLLDCEGEFMDSFLLLFGLAQVRRHEA